ncbi:MAG: helix-turn-helix transcriptional regulator [Oscillospiraceae bacterium]
MELAYLLKQIRTSIGMTQVQIAKELNLSFSTINRWENGKAKPNRLASVTVLALAKEKGAPPQMVKELENVLFSQNMRFEERYFYDQQD